MGEYWKNNIPNEHGASGRPKARQRRESRMGMETCFQKGSF